MNKLTLFLLLALTTYVLNTTLADLNIKSCTTIDISNTKPPQLISDFEEDYCYSLKTRSPYTHCCYFEGSTNIKGCYEITDDQFENIGRFKKFVRDQIEDDNVGIHCSSRFISFSMLAVLALLF